jgi:predicted component of type VI protein secretion system
MEASLVMFKADGQRKEFPFRSSSIVVGRKNTCDLRIPLSSVSRQHFRIDREDDTLKLHDLGSSNGTFYNGERTLEAELEAGDQIRVGPVTFIVVIDGEPADIEPIKTVLPAESGEVASAEELEEEAAQAEAAEAPATAPTPAQPEAIEAGDEMPEAIEEEAHTPTVEIEDDGDDEDPIAALEALAASGGDEDEEDEPIPFFDDDEEEEEQQNKR